ncbi:MAG: CDP-diacylglycerol--serine O-phosphatidyltransferase [Deltaproteobacteria bacterium]
MATNNRKKQNFFRRGKKSETGDDQSVARQKKRIRINKMKKGIFILPSLLTLTSIFLSFYAIISAINENFVLAGALILAAAFFDGIDGKVARLTKTTTRFGLELDSLADVISFGVAPALLMYIWALAPYGRVGWVSAFVFVSCGALRLARFNVQSGQIDPKRFIGLPIPAAAAMIAVTVLFFHKLGLNGVHYRLPLLLLNFALSYLMVSQVKFHAFKDLGFAKQKPFSSTVGFVLLLALIAASPFVVPFFLLAAYVISGPVLTVTLHQRAKKRLQQAEREAERKDVEATS